jgi:hypothetical protein
MANIADILVAIFLVFLFAVGMLLCIYVNDQITNSDVFQTQLTEEQRAPMTTVRTVTKGFDAFMLVLFLGLGIVTIISAVFIRTHPVLFVLMIIMQLILIGLSTIFSNLWYAIASRSEFVSIANELPYTTLIFTNLPLFVLIISAIVAIASYGKVTPPNV